MKVISFLVGMLSFSAMAAVTPISLSDMAKLTSSQRQDIQKQKARLDDLKRQESRLRTEIDRAQPTSYCLANTEADLNKCRETWSNANEKVRELNRAADVLNSDISKSEESYNKQLETYRAEAANRMATARAEQTARDREIDQIRALDDEIQKSYSQLSRSAQGLLLDVTRGRLNLAEMEKNIDKSGLGLYLQSKMHALMNDPMVCTAVKQCASATNPSLEKNRFQKIFNNATPETIRENSRLSTPKERAGNK